MQVVTELIANPDSISKSKEFETVIVSALDQNGKPMEGVLIRAEESGRKAVVEPSSEQTDENGEAEFDVKFETFRKIIRVTFEADGVETTVNQN